MADSPYPELKRTHTMARSGRPWRDVKPPPAAPVWAVIQGFADYWVLVAALDLGVFDALARREQAGEGPADLEAIAEAVGGELRPLGALVDALVALAFLETVPAGYVLAEVTGRYLVRGGPASMVDLVAVANGPMDNWPALANTVRTGRPPAPVEDDPVEFYRPLVEATFPTQHRAALRLGARIGVGRTPGLRVLDLGAGAGAWSLGVLVSCPASTAVVNDLAGVVEMAGERATAMGLADRVTLRPGDYHQIEIEPRSYDLVIAAHVCRAEGPEGTRRLLRRAAAALVPGGRIIVAEYARGTTRTTNPFAARMGATLVASTTAGDTPTGPELVAALRSAGFEAIRLHEPIGGQQAYVATLTPPLEEQR